MMMALDGLFGARRAPLFTRKDSLLITTLNHLSSALRHAPLRSPRYAYAQRSPARRLDTTIAAFLAGYDNPATRQTYEKALRVFAEAVGPQRRLDEITPDRVDGWHRQLRASGLAVVTVAKRTKVIKTFWNWCVRREYILVSPARFLVVKQPPPQPGSKAISGEVLAAMFEAVQHKRCAFLAARDTALLALLITFGARAGDVTRLKLGGVDLDRHQIVFRVKGARDLRLPLPPHTARYLAAWLAIRRQLQPEPAHDYVFVNIHTRPGRRYAPLASESLSTLVSRLSAQVSGRVYGPHAIRHWRGQSLADQRVPPTVVQAILGHSSVQITLTHYYNQDMRRVQYILELYEVGCEWGWLGSGGEDLLWSI
jgi:integrase